MGVRGDDMSGCDITLDLGDNGLCLRDTLENVGNSYIKVQPKFGLGVKSQRWPRRDKKLTLNTRRILFRSALQPAIIWLSFFAWKAREIPFCLLRSTTLLRMSATVLRLVRWKHR